MCTVIQVNCPACGASTTTADENAGKQGRCRCGEVFVIALQPAAMTNVFVAFNPPKKSQSNAPGAIPAVAWAALVAGMIGVSSGAILGMFAAHFAPLWGGVLLLASPGTDIRWTLAPGHMALGALVFGVIFAICGLVIARRFALARRHLVIGSGIAAMLLVACYEASTFIRHAPSEQRKRELSKAERKKAARDAKAVLLATLKRHDPVTGQLLISFLSRTRWEQYLTGDDHLIGARAECPQLSKTSEAVYEKWLTAHKHANREREAARAALHQLSTSFKTIEPEVANLIIVEMNEHYDGRISLEELERRIPITAANAQVKSAFGKWRTARTTELE